MNISENNSRRDHVFARTYLLAALIALAASVGLAHAQAQDPSGNAAVQQARLFNERPSSENSANGEQLFAPLEGTSGGESAADVDVGEQWLLHRSLPANPFTARASLSLFYTDNVALSRRSTFGDAFAVADLGFGYRRPFATDWAFAIDLQQSFFRYDRYTAFDFESSNVNVAISHQARQFGDILFSLQYSLSRLTAGSVDDQLYLGNTFSLAATKVVQINPANAVDFNGALGYTFADPSDLARVEVRAALGYTLRLARNFTATAVARLEFYDYTNDTREDLLQSVALGARWDLNDWMFLSASISVANNLSSQPVFSYQALNTGTTLTAHIRF